MRFQQKKLLIIALVFSLIGFLAFNSCSDSSIDTDREEGKDKTVSDLIYLRGTQIITKYSAWPIPENEVPAVDTTRISFIMKIHSIRGERNSIRIYGLEGADVGKREDYLYPDCKDPDDCIVTGKLEDEVLDIQLTNNGRSYEASGNIYQTYDPYVEMAATYSYQNTTIEYDLEGGVDEE